MKTVQDMVSFNQANLAAFADAGRILAMGLQDFSKQAIAATQAQFSASLAHMKSLSGVTSMERVVEIQTQAVRSTVETNLAETGRLAEAAIKLVADVAAPITLRADAALQVFARAA